MFYNTFVYLFFGILLLFLVGLCFVAIGYFSGKNEDKTDEEKNDEDKHATEPNESMHMLDEWNFSSIFCWKNDYFLYYWKTLLLHY